MTSTSTLDERADVSDWPAPKPPGATMHAAVIREFGGPEVLHEETVPTPTAGPGEVLVQVAAVSIGRLLDVAARAGRHPYQGFSFPHILGAEHAGLIAAVGPAVTGWSVGDRVAGFPVLVDRTCELCRSGHDELCENLQLVGMHRPGAYAEFLALPATNVHRVPDGISPAQVTALALSGAVAMNQLLSASFAPGQWVLVQGASSALGSLSANLVRHLGGHVIVTSRSAEKRARLAELGADAVLDSYDPDLVPAVAATTGGRGVDIVLDNLGEPDIWRSSLRVLRPGGRLVSSGAFLGGEVSVDLRRLYLNGQQIIGVRSGNDASVAALWAEVGRGFRPVLDTTFPLAQASEAHRFVEGDNNVGRVALTVD